MSLYVTMPDALSSLGVEERDDDGLYYKDLLDMFCTAFRESERYFNNTRRKKPQRVLCI